MAVLVGSPVAAQQSDIAAATAGSPYPVSDVTEYAGRYRAVGRGACPPSDGSSLIDAYPSVPASHSTDGPIVTTATSSESDVETNRPRPASPGRPVRTWRRPARFLDTVQACCLATPNFAACAGRRVAGGNVNAAHGSQSDGLVGCSRSACSVVVRVCPLTTSSMDIAMSDPNSETKHEVAAATYQPAGAPAAGNPEQPRKGLTAQAASGGRPRACTIEPVAPRRRRGSRFTAPTVHFPAQQCPLCDLDRMFDTRNAFSHHLQDVHDSF